MNKKKEEFRKPENSGAWDKESSHNDLLSPTLSVLQNASTRQLPIDENSQGSSESSSESEEESDEDTPLEFIEAFILESNQLLAFFYFYFVCF